MKWHQHQSNFKRVISLLSSASRVDTERCDGQVEKFSQFLEEIKSIGSDKFLQFSREENRVDVFLKEHMCTKFPHLFDIVKVLLVLSHGNASVERGFSVNKELEVEN